MLKPSCVWGNGLIFVSIIDPESHILFFDIEALIIELLSEEYDMMSPGSLEAAGLISASEYFKVAALTQSASPDAHKKIVGKCDIWFGCKRYFGNHKFCSGVISYQEVDVLPNL